MLRFCPIFRQI